MSNGIVFWTGGLGGSVIFGSEGALLIGVAGAEVLGLYPYPTGCVGVFGVLGAPGVVFLAGIPVFGSTLKAPGFLGINGSDGFGISLFGSSFFGFSPGGRCSDILYFIIRKTGLYTLLPF